MACPCPFQCLRGCGVVTVWDDAARAGQAASPVGVTDGVPVDVSVVVVDGVDVAAQQAGRSHARCQMDKGRDSTHRCWTPLGAAGR